MTDRPPPRAAMDGPEVPSAPAVLAALRREGLHSADAFWAEAFSRQLGLLGREDLERLRTVRVAVLGLRGIGGAAFLSLVKAGVGWFTVAESARVTGDDVSLTWGLHRAHVGRPFIDVFAEEAVRTNPYLQIRTFSQGLGGQTADEFLVAADLLVNLLDGTQTDVERLIMRKAHDRGVVAIRCASEGAGAGLRVFSPHGMTFDRFKRSPPDQGKGSQGPQRDPAPGPVAQLVGAALVSTAVISLSQGRSSLPAAPRGLSIDPVTQYLETRDILKHRRVKCVKEREALAADSDRLKDVTLAMAGLGATGTAAFLALVRSGVTRFRLADFDTLEPSNLCRQWLARPDTWRRSKVDVLMEEARAINPSIHIVPFSQGIRPETIDAFLEGVDLVIDSMDLFSYRDRLMLLRRAKERGVGVVSTANLGFGAAVHVFDPKGMSVDEWVDFDSQKSEEKIFSAFAVSLIPHTVSSHYTDPSRVSLEARVGPAVGAGSDLAGALAATEVVRWVQDRASVDPVPAYFQVDFKRGCSFRGRISRGMKAWRQRVRQRFLLARYWGKNLGFRPVPPPDLPRVRVSRLPIPDEVLHGILKAGIQAGSGNNVQLWQFVRKGDCVTLRIRPELDSSFFDFRQYASLLSAGGVLENMRVAATAHGVEMVVDQFPGGAPGPDVATVSFRLTAAPRDLTYNALWERHTNRRYYDGRPLAPATLDALRHSVETVPGVGWHHVTDPADLRGLARAMYAVDILRSERRDLHENLHEMLRFSPEEVYATRDGLPLRNLKAGWHGEWFLRLTHPWPVMAFLNRFGVSRGVAGFAYRELTSASAVVLLTVPHLDPPSVVRAGQAFERVWLNATLRGLSLQPMASLPLFLLRRREGELGDLGPRHRRLLDKAAREEENVFPHIDFDRESQILLFRLGYAPDIEIGTLRRDLSSFFGP